MPVEEEPIRCLTCVAEGLKARTLAIAAVMDDDTYFAMAVRPRRHRREAEQEAAAYVLGYPAEPWPLKGPGERTEGNPRPW